MPEVYEGKDAWATVQTSGTTWSLLATIPQGAPLNSTGTHKIVVQARRRDGDGELSKVWSFLVSWRLDDVAGFTQVGPIIGDEPQGDIGTESWGYEVNAGSGQITVGSTEVFGIDWAYTADYVIYWVDSIVLLEDIDDSQTTFIVSDTTLLDDPLILVDGEWMGMVSRTLPGPIGSITVTRGAQGTTPASHSLGAFIYTIALA